MPTRWLRSRNVDTQTSERWWSEKISMLPYLQLGRTFRRLPLCEGGGLAPGGALPVQGSSREGEASHHREHRMHGRLIAVRPN